MANFMMPAGNPWKKMFSNIPINESLFPTSRRTSSQVMEYTSCAVFMVSSAQSVQKLVVNIIEAPIGHDHNVISLSYFTSEKTDNVIRRRESKSFFSPSAN